MRDGRVSDRREFWWGAAVLLLVLVGHGLAPM